MKFFTTDQFKQGWIIGNFEPSIIMTPHCELAIKRYKAGDIDERHVHHKAEEITVIVSGIFQMNKKTLQADDIVLIEKNESSEFTCIEDGAVVSFKIPSVIGDKHIVK